jgi:hypothetical protein
MARFTHWTPLPTPHPEIKVVDLEKVTVWSVILFTVGGIAFIFWLGARVLGWC